VKWEKLCELARELPDVTVEKWWGTPGFKVHGHGFARLKEDGQSVMFGVADLDEKDMLLATQPDVYFTTPHYDGYPAVLARLSTLRVADARLRLERCWQPASVLPVKKTKKKKASKPRARSR
jgi:hypothetical protein